MKYYLIGGGLSLIISIFWYYPTIFYLFLFTIYSLILICSAICVTIYLSSPPPARPSNTKNILYNATKSSIFDAPEPIRNASALPIIFGKTVDLQLQQIIEFVVRDFITPWLDFIVTKPKNLTDTIREDIWNGIIKLRERCNKIDSSKIIAVDMVNRITIHLEKIRIAEARATEIDAEPKFSINSYLQNEEKEMQFLRKLSEIIIIFLLPRGYSLSPLKILISEIISYKLFFPLIKTVTSPQYINHKIIETIETRLAAVAINKKTYEYASSFEDFLKVINNTENFDELSRIRGSIINDLIQAVTIQNLQKTKDTENEGEDKATQRLKKYIQQLTFAKNQCEKNLNKYGWNGQSSNETNLPLSEILNTVIGRRYLTIFLEPLKASDLVGYYTAAEELKSSSKSSWHQIGTEIFYTYIRCPKPEITIEKSERKQVETFLLGDVGPEIFYEIQNNVLKTLEEKYYPSFLLSDQFIAFKEALNSDEIIEVPNLIIDPQDDDIEVLKIDESSTYARSKLERIQERLNNKNQALEALKSSVKPESKIFSVLEREVDWLKSEKRQIEAHLIRTELWSEHLGHWKADIQSVEISDDKEGGPQFMILIHIDEDFKSENISSGWGGWGVLRSLGQFHELHRKLRPLSQELKQFELPTAFKIFFIKSDKNALEKVKEQIQKFINYILHDDKLSQSEAVFAFLSPSSEHLKHGNYLSSPKKSKFSLSTLFNKNETNNSCKNPEKDTFWGLQNFRDNDDFLKDLDGSTINLHPDLESKDSIAEPLYTLMDEIFDMGGLFKWFRKSLISFVQITYGRTINRQIRESIAYLYEETMLHFYVTSALKSFWPGGVLATTSSVVGDTESAEKLKEQAKELLLNNIPEVLINLIGGQTVKHGSLKVFDALQNPIYNKQLFYEFLEILMLEVFPEIRQIIPKPKLNANGK